MQVQHPLNIINLNNYYILYLRNTSFLCVIPNFPESKNQVGKGHLILLRVADINQNNGSITTIGIALKVNLYIEYIFIILPVK